MILRFSSHKRDYIPLWLGLRSGAVSAYNLFKLSKKGYYFGIFEIVEFLFTGFHHLSINVNSAWLDVAFRIFLHFSFTYWHSIKIHLKWSYLVKNINYYLIIMLIVRHLWWGWKNNSEIIGYFFVCWTAEKTTYREKYDAH